MVKISPEEVMAQRRERSEMAALPQWKRAALGNSARIDIPFDNLKSVATAADVLKELAAYLSQLSNRSDLDPYTILIQRSMKSWLPISRSGQRTAARIRTALSQTNEHVMQMAIRTAGANTLPFHIHH